MKKLALTIILSITSLIVFPQKVEDVISKFANEGCAKFESLNEKEWRYARYALSKIDPPFYELDRWDQEKDTVNSFWFDKVFTRFDGNNYTLDFKKVIEGAARNDVGDIPEVKDFSFIGMDIALLQKARTIQNLELDGCPADVKVDFATEAKKLTGSYSVLFEVQDSEDDVIILKNKEEDSFNELIFVIIGEEPHLMKLEGTFEISDVSAPTSTYD